MISAKELNVSRETYEKLKIYESLLLKWQKAINLVSRGTLEHYWERHVRDSLQIIPHIRGKNILDIGSGGGFPGMVLAMVGDWDVVCVDSDKRKMLFLAEVARMTDTAVRLEACRIEQLRLNGFDTLCARGFASLTKLLDVMVGLRSEYGVFLKGAKLEAELEKAATQFDFKYEKRPSETNGNGYILTVHSIGKRK
ncbi:MAG: 16S rRNA (guanine(527)-N(7))-methyltransferase RsmG [Holosporaceae bacterium]|jgi:16S rRNA (guanine527-N7)-methyltransferase|nr:16S rRNA (guanine(527)-N(7))-methyltransferase RsmG [Holosporaceae bacterium]